MKKYRNKEWLEQKYCSEKMSTIEIAALFGCDPTTIQNWLVGMAADEVLKLRGEDFAVKGPRVLEVVDGRLVVEWYYADCTVVLKYDGQRYRVVGVKERESQE